MDQPSNLSPDGPSNLSSSQLATLIQLRKEWEKQSAEDLTKYLRSFICSFWDIDADEWNYRTVRTALYLTNGTQIANRENTALFCEEAVSMLNELIANKQSGVPVTRAR